MQPDITKNLATVKKLISEYEIKYKRPPGSVQLLAVSKAQSIENIREAINAGQKSFGENYLQEALEKISALASEKLEWHFIGPIQSNKTRKIAENFHWVHTVSNFKIAQRLNDQRPAQLPPLNICLQVNISQEASKSGTTAEQIFELAEACLTLPNLNLRGLMAIPAEKNIFTEQRAECHKLRVLEENLHARGIKTDTLSLGMSGDLEAAIAENATLVRIGTKIFDFRQ
jgi:pyridoxal phosphate enzyme (YggS family)